MKLFLLASLIISLLSVAWTFDDFVRSDPSVDATPYEKLLLEFGYFFANLVILVISLLFGWI